MRYARSLMILVSSILLFPAYAAQSAEIELPKIEATCKTDREFLLPVLVPAPFLESSLDSSVLMHSVEDRAKFEALIAAKQWDQAFVEFQNSPDWVKSNLMRSLINAMVGANEVQRASQFLIQQSAPRSEMRAKGVGTIAAALTQRDQFSKAIEMLKTIPQNSDYLRDAVVPVVEALTKTNQIGNIAEVMTIFPDEEARSSFWYFATRRIAFQPEQAKQLAGSIENREQRSNLIEDMAKFWLREEGEAVLNGWKIAAEIENCSTRLLFFMDAFDRLKLSKLKPLNVARSLDELEALLNARDASSSYKRLDQRVLLARFNIEHGRKAQGEKLLAQVTTALKAEPHTSRASLLIEVSKQYQQLGQTAIAVQMLDSAVISTHESFKPQSTRVNEISLPMIMPPTEWKYELLEQIAKQYRSLNQTRKASAIEKTIPKRSRPRLPEIYSIPPASIPPASIPPLSQPVRSKPTQRR